MARQTHANGGQQRRWHQQNIKWIHTQACGFTSPWVRCNAGVWSWDRRYIDNRTVFCYDWKPHAREQTSARGKACGMRSLLVDGPVVVA